MKLGAPTIQMRTAVGRDLDALLECDPSYDEKRLLELIRSGDNSVATIAVAVYHERGSDEIVMGYVAFRVRKRWKEVLHVATLPVFRRQGVAAEMLRRLRAANRSTLPLVARPGGQHWEGHHLLAACGYQMVKVLATDALLFVLRPFDNVPNFRVQ